MGNQRQQYMNDALVLDEKQKKAFAQLKRAFNACSKANIRLYAELNNFYAINGNHMHGKRVGIGEVCNDIGDSVSDNAECINPECFAFFAADDGLTIQRKDGARKFNSDYDS